MTASYTVQLENFVQKYDSITHSDRRGQFQSKVDSVSANRFIYIARGIDNNRCSVFQFVAVACAALTMLAASPLHTWAQSPENVAVVINDNSPESQRIGQAYAAARSIPDSNVFHVRTATEETINRDIFLRTVHNPLVTAISRSRLHDRILYIVLTKGIPLRVAGSQGQTGSIASVDSELTLLYRRMTGRLDKPEGPIPNPYFLGDREITDARPFTHRDFDIFLVSRLDAYTVEDALSLIDKATSTATEGRIVLDQRQASDNSTGDSWLALASKRLTDRNLGDRVVLETTPKPARDVMQVLGYYSWGSTDPQNRVRSTGLRFAPGALAAMYVGSDARTFQEPPVGWTPTADAVNRASWYGGSPESLTGDLIRDGVTGVAGYVAQPFLQGSIRPQILFPAYVAGFNLVEAFYLAMPFLSWQTVVIGDPLCGPFPRKTLSRAEIEEGIDPGTDLPTLFGKRRLATIIELAPDVPERAAELFVRAEGLRARADDTGASEALDEAIKIAPRYVTALAQKALLDEAAGRHDEAFDIYKRILEIDANSVTALNNMAFTLAERRHMPKEALPLAQRAVALAPMNPLVLDTLGWIHHLLGDNVSAAKVMQQVVKTNILNADVRLHAAVVFAAVGASEAAKNELAIALKLDPALINRSEVKQLQAQFAKSK